MSTYRYIAVEGPIGVGKTSLVEKLSQDLNAQLVLEEPEKNPFLPQFYKNHDKKGKDDASFQTQVFFLLSRFSQQKALAQQNLFQQSVISDYIFAKDKIFAYLNLSEDELNLYENIYQQLDTRIIKPDLVIFLQANVDILKDRVKKRGFDYEKNISTEYLEELYQAYNQFFFQYNDTPLLTVNCSEIDFIGNLEDYNQLVREIANMESSGQKKHFVSISSQV